MNVNAINVCKIAKELSGVAVESAINQVIEESKKEVENRLRSYF
jgi:hypothetical protein